MSYLLNHLLSIVWDYYDTKNFPVRGDSSPELILELIDSMDNNSRYYILPNLINFNITAIVKTILFDWKKNATPRDCLSYLNVLDKTMNILIWNGNNNLIYDTCKQILLQCIDLGTIPKKYGLYTYLDKACRNGHLQIVKSLTKIICVVHNANGNNCVPYVTAIINGHRDIARFLEHNLLKNNEIETVKKIVL